MTTRQDVLELREELQDHKHLVAIERGAVKKIFVPGSGSNWARATRGSCRAPECDSSMPSKIWHRRESEWPHCLIADEFRS